MTMNSYTIITVSFSHSNKMPPKQIWIGADLFSLFVRCLCLYFPDTLKFSSPNSCHVAAISHSLRACIFLRVWRWIMKCNEASPRCWALKIKGCLLEQKEKWKISDSRISVRNRKKRSDFHEQVPWLWLIYEELHFCCKLINSIN